MSDLFTQYQSASARLNDLISSLPRDRRSHAEELMRPLYEVVILDKEPFTAVLQRFLVVGMLGAMMGVAPIGITVGIVADLSGLSHVAGKWMFFASTLTWSIGFSLGAMIGRRSPGRTIL